MMRALLATMEISRPQALPVAHSAMPERGPAPTPTPALLATLDTSRLEVRTKLAIALPAVPGCGLALAPTPALIVSPARTPRPPPTTSALLAPLELIPPQSRNPPQLAWPAPSERTWPAQQMMFALLATLDISRPKALPVALPAMPERGPPPNPTPALLAPLDLGLPKLRSLLTIALPAPPELTCLPLLLSRALIATLDTSQPTPRQVAIRAGT